MTEPCEQNCSGEWGGSDDTVIAYFDADGDGYTVGEEQSVCDDLVHETELSSTFTVAGILADGSSDYCWNYGYCSLGFEAGTFNDVDGNAPLSLTLTISGNSSYCGSPSTGFTHSIYVNTTVVD